ncbi:biotin transporter BioY [Halovulum dunhuangense]|uniref:Biotin transporter n=1 Tax=Halovulum dunhuangense TaxID=1505036 RepID=A0A849L2Y9_9RHOB|nr:biotin transporter BioY [Halovulum dunhuangense]NNU80623.1 biotin transporter BioY [Halovulum dunhuangense]
MATAMTDKVLADLGPDQGTALWIKRVALVVLGVALLAATAKIKVMIPPSPVPITMTTFAVLTIGAAYGARLGFATVFGYLALGAMGYDVFASSSATANGIAYMGGSTGGYLLGYLLATAAIGALARRGWDRSVGGMALAMLVGTALIYVPGVAWLGMLYGWDQPILAWGLTPFLIGDAMKLALAALILPLVWKLVGDART